MAITCEPLIDVKTILQPMMLMSVFKGEEVPIDALIDVYIQDAITKKLLASVELPQEFADFGEIICLQLEMNKVKTVTAVLRGEQPPEGAGLDKALETLVSLQMLSALTKALEGGSSQGGGTGQAG